MFAPPVAKPKAKHPQRSTIEAQRPGQSAAGQANMLQPNIGTAAHAAVPLWDFSKIPVFSPDRAQRFQNPSSFPAPRPTGSVQAKLNAGPVHGPRPGHQAQGPADVLAEPERDFPGEGVRALWRIPTNAPGDPEEARSSFGSDGRLPLQRKLMVGSTTDPLEAEADQVAEHVLAKRPGSVSGTGAGPAGVVRRCACGASGRTCEACGKEKNKTIRRRATANVAPVEAPPVVHDVIRSSGMPLDDGLRRDMEDGLGFDFSRVRVHTEGAADAAARAMGAHAFTTGHNIVFAQGQYAPAHTSGRRLIAHELAHVMQQGGPAEATAPIGRKPAKAAQHDPAADASSRLDNRAAAGLIQRSPNQSIDPLSALTGESDIYAAPTSNRPVEQMSKSEVDDEINRLERWLGKQNRSTPEVVKRESRLADLRRRQTELGAPVKAHRATPVVAVKPRCLTKGLDITQMTRDEMAAELDSTVQFLRLGPSKSDIAKVTPCKIALEQALTGQREQENEEVRKRDIALALQPITSGNTYEDFRKVLTVIASIAQDPNNTAQAAIYLPNGMRVPVSNDEAIALKTGAANMIRKYAAQSESLAEETYEAFEERRQKGKEHPIVHGLVKWAADVDDLDELEMFGKKEQARHLLAQIKGLANSGSLIPAFNVSLSLDIWSEGYARQVGEWEATLMNSAGRWVLGLTILKEGLTLLATAGAGSLISSARTARGISALRATVEVAGATTFAGTAGAVGGYAASEKLTGGKITREGLVKTGRVGAGTGLAIGAAPGAVAAANDAFKVGKAATTVGNVVRGVGAEVVGNTPVNVASAGIQGESLEDAAISSVTNSALSGGSSQVLAKFAKGGKVVKTVAGAGLGGTVATIEALATGKDAPDTILAAAFGTAGGALGPHLEESNTNYLSGQSRSSSTKGALEPPAADERFDFSDSASGSGVRSGSFAPPAKSGVSRKFDLSDVGGLPPADSGSGSKAATAGTTGGTPASSATSVTSDLSIPALTGSRRTSFGGPNERPLPADVDLDEAVARLEPAKARPAGSPARTGYSRTAPTSGEEIVPAFDRTRGRAIDRGRGARPRYANDPVKPKVTTRPAKRASRAVPDAGEAVKEATGGTGTAKRPARRAKPSPGGGAGGAAPQAGLPLTDKQKARLIRKYVKSGKVTKVEPGESGIKDPKPKRPQKEITARPKDIPFESQRAEQMGDAEDAQEVKALKDSETPKGKQQSVKAETGNWAHNDLPRYLAYFKATGRTADARRLRRILKWPSGVVPNKRSFIMSDGRPGIPDGLGEGIVYELKPDTETEWARRGEYQASEYAEQLNKEKYLGRTDWRPEVITYSAKSLERLLRKWGVLEKKRRK